MTRMSDGEAKNIKEYLEYYENVAKSEFKESEFLEFGKNTEGYLVPYAIFTSQVDFFNQKNNYAGVFMNYKDRMSNSFGIEKENVVFKYLRGNNKTYAAARKDYFKNIGEYYSNVFNTFDSLKLDYKNNFNNTRQLYQELRNEFIDAGELYYKMILMYDMYSSIENKSFADFRIVNDRYSNIRDYLASLDKPKRELKDKIHVKSFVKDFESIDSLEDFYLVFDKYLASLV